MLETFKIPLSGITTNEQLSRVAYRVYHSSEVCLCVTHYRRNRNESGIVNLDNSENAGTQWVAYAKKRNNAVYFDGFGNLRPSRELEYYLGSNITYNHRSYQTFDQSICGQLCLQFLREIDWRKKYM